ncbi:MAG: cysteine--tRNA ligase [Anaerohalosphaeraceae bacterium]|nr:cysteine--tRNA ligase [Anaerohalosphaeraceae bacterium]
MTLQFYNTLTRQKEIFKPIEPGKVKIYSCGPTVYSHPHIGNFRSFLVADLLKRFLVFKGFKVTHIMNITDVGHLIDDADEGADKLEEQAKKQKKEPLEIAKFYADSFFAASKLLNIIPADRYPKATEHIDEMIEMVKILIDKSYAYAVNGNVYYDVTKFKNYGQLSGNTIEDLNAGARIGINPEKKNPQDFALWKHDEKHLQQWASPWGKGFPGWHIECSAMSSKYLGDEFDIHTGGEDNIFPHHECEIAQSEAASGKKFVHYWLHARFLLFDGEKMSKSKGNLYTIDELIEKGFRKNAVRYALISSHYKQNYNFTFDGLRAAEQAIDKIQQCVFRLTDLAGNAPQGEISEQSQSLVNTCLADFDEALSDDLNISKALAVLFDFIREANKADGINIAEAKLFLKTIEKIDSVLGILETKKEDVPEEIIALAEKRKQARADKDWARADSARDEIAAKGWILEDIPAGGYRIKRREDTP